METTPWKHYSMQLMLDNLDKRVKANTPRISPLLSNLRWVIRDMIKHKTRSKPKWFRITKDTTRAEGRRCSLRAKIRHVEGVHRLAKVTLQVKEISYKITFVRDHVAGQNQDNLQGIKLQLGIPLLKMTFLWINRSRFCLIKCLPTAHSKWLLMLKRLPLQVLKTIMLSPGELQPLKLPMLTQI